VLTKPLNNDALFKKYVDLFRSFMLNNEMNDIATIMSNIYGLISFTSSVFRSEAVAQTFLYFCMHGAATPWVLQCELNMPEATIYRCLKRLRALKIIFPAIKTKKPLKSKGGPQVTVWALEGSAAENVASAIRLHTQMLSPKYRAAEKIAQTILEDYLNTRKLTEISMKEVVLQVKAQKSPFPNSDIAVLTCNYLREKGIKVWT